MKAARRGPATPLPRGVITLTEQYVMLSSPARVAGRAATPVAPARRTMKNFDSRVFGIGDFVEWEKNKQLVLNPAFQRRSVWNDKAKRFLIDTILRGKPIPKFFIRQTINVSTKTSLREVVDGQQRLRTILSFVKDGFAVSRVQNKEFGGKLFSQLPEDVQAQFLSYEVAVDLLINLPNEEILDIFSRLNSYAVILNEQEKLNANHFGPFKILADNVGRKYNEYWKESGIFSDREILRMAEVNLVADIFISLMEGIKSKKQIRGYYKKYEETFNSDPDEFEAKFDEVVATIKVLYPEGLGATEFKRPFMYYTLFTAIAHCKFSIPGLEAPRPSLKTVAETQNAREGLDKVDEIFSGERRPTDEQRQFLTDSQRATTDQSVRERRTKFLLALMT
jgi:Protein of unknown function DUF262